MKSIDQVRKALAARRKQQQGLTLIEAAMVLGVAALVIAGVLALYSSANSANKTQEALNQLNIVQQAVRNVYASQADFTGLGDGSTVGAQLKSALPAKMVKSGGTDAMKNAYNGDITVSTSQNAAAPGGFDIAFDGLPPDACIALGTKDYGRSMVNIKVNGGESGLADGIPDAGLVQGWCATPTGTAGSSIITWSFAN